MPVAPLRLRRGRAPERTGAAPSRLITIVLGIALAILFAVLPLVPPPPAAGAAGPAAGRPAPAQPPPVDAQSVIVVDALTGQVLYERNADRRLPMASTTKVMTALLAIERGDPDQVITTSERAWGVEGSSLYLALGEQRTLRELLYGLMLQSGNDAAVAIAEGLAGSVEEFVRWMNQRAAELGLENTRFADPHGLASKDHYTSARDLATLARVAMRNPAFREIVGTREYRMPWPEKQGERVLYNHNRFLWRYEGATGIKNGYTTAARGALVASAERDGVELIAVVLGAHPTGMYRDVAGLMDWAFARFEPLNVVTEGEEVGLAAVAGGATDAVSARTTHGSRLLVVRGARPPAIERRLEWISNLRAPLPAGARVGTLILLRDGKEIDRVPLVSAAAVEARANLRRAGGAAWPSWLPVAGLGLAILVWWVAQARRRARYRRRWRRRVAGLDPLWYAYRLRDPGAD